MPLKSRSCGSHSLHPIVAAIVAFAILTASPADEPTLVIPRAEMPESVFQVLSNAIASYTFPETARDDPQGKNAKALEALLQAPLARLRQAKAGAALSHQHQSSRPVTLWCLPQEGDRHLALLPMLTEAKIPAREVAKIEPCSYADYLAALIQYIEDRDPAKRQPWEFTFVRDIGSRRRVVSQRSTLVL